MKRETIKLEFSGVEIAVEDIDYNLSKYPMGILTKMMLKANEIGLQGKKIEVIEVKENFVTNNKYIDFIINPNN